MDAVCTTEGDLNVAELVRLARLGDEPAFDRLARHYRAAVLAITFSRVGNREEAEDLAQEVLLKAQAKIGELREPEAFPAWLKMIALNACRTWFRRSVPWPESLDAIAGAAQLPDRSPTPLAVLLEKEKQRAWRRALIVLPQANRLALLMHLWGGYSYDEIAAFAEVPITTIEGRIHRAKAHLRRVLKSDAGELLGEPRRRWQKENGRDE